MNSSLLKKSLPHLIAIAVFVLIAVIYCKPAVEGKILYQSDIIAYKGMAQQSVEFREKHGHFPLWTESMFGGMPAYNIAMDARSPIQTIYLAKVITLGLPEPISFFFLACICFYILTQVLRINPWIGIFTSIAYAYSTYDPIIIAVGHQTKMMAIGYMPAVVASLLLIFQRKYLAGAALFTLFMGLQASTQHLQIIYYTGILLGIITITQIVYGWRQKQIKHTFIGIAIALAAGVIGFFNYAVIMLPTREYAEDTMRGGKSELTGDHKNKTKGGLDKDYAFGWSYGIGETFTLFVPGMYGGGSGGKELTGNSKFAEKFTEMGMPEDNALRIANSSAYWGPQPGTSGPVYLGAIVCFLFVFGLIYVKSRHKWWIASAAVIGILLAWGKHFSVLNYFLFDHLPFYNKFRAPSMGLVIPQLVFPLLGALGLDQLLISGPESRDINWKKFKLSVFITAGILVLLTAFYFMGDFKGANDNLQKQNLNSFILQQSARGKQPTPEMLQQANEFTNALMKGLQSDRQGIFGADLLRSFMFVAIATVLLGLYLKNKIKPAILLAGLAIFCSYDLLAEGKKYLNEDNYVEPADIESVFSPTPADLVIDKDPDKNVRVLDQSTSDPFQDAHISYHHNSVGGYHPAKLALYDDLIKNQLTKGNMMVYNMLNTKYFIRRNPANGQDEAMINPNAFGSCWLVKSIHYVNNADEEMKALDSINVKDTAIIDKRFQQLIKFNPVADSSASIKLIENLNDKLSYSFSSKTNQFAVFSEIYYDKGWNAFIDGNKADYCKVDYVLRGMPVPAGDHKIEFRFEPRSYDIGNTITVWAAIITFLLLIAAAVAAWRKKTLV